MKEKPILFSGPMIRAILAGTKTQTRRVAKLTHGAHVKEPGGNRRWHPADPEARLACPYGKPGDLLWVRETWGMTYVDRVESDRPFIVGGTWGSPSRPGRPPCVVFKADGSMPDDSPLETARWSPSIHMPRWASRLTLRVTSVRVERLQDIDESDAWREGVDRIKDKVPTHRDAFQLLWDSINAERAPWASNPWVWVVSFEAQRESK